MLTSRRVLRIWKSTGILLLGLAAGVAGTYAYVHSLSGTVPHRSAQGIALEELKLRAAAAHGSETFCMAVGEVDDGVDGVFMLDYLTGDLTCFVLSPTLSKFNIAFKTNVTQQLTAEKGKKPSYVLAVGRWSPTGGRVGNIRPANCVVYVADTNTGKFAAYSFPWNEAITRTKAFGGANPMVLLDSGVARDLQLRQ